MLNRRELLGLAGAGLAAATLPTACSSSGSSPSAQTPSTLARNGGATRIKPGTPNADTIHGWISDIVDFGIRRPGHPADNRTVDWLIERFGDLGLEKVRKEPFTTNRFTAGTASLHVTAAGKTETLPCYPVAYTASANSVTAQLTAYDADNPTSMKDKAVFRSFEMTRIPASTMAMLGSVAKDQPWQDRVVDEHHTLESDTIVSSFDNAQDPVDSSTKAGAKAFIGVWLNQPGNTCNHYMPYQGAQQSIPGVWIKPTDALRLQGMLDAGDVTIRLSVHTETTPATTHIIVGELPGADDHQVIVGSHHDGPWASAVEDASGTALVLAQAAHWANVPQAKRPHRLVFVLQGGHFANKSKAYSELHEDELDNVVLEVHAEHVGRSVKIPAKPTDTDHTALQPLDEPFPRWWFVSQVADLRSRVLSIVRDEAIDRSLILAPDAVGDIPPTDAAGFFFRHVPCVSLLAAPDYMFDDTDTIEMVHKPSLEPITRALARIVAGTAGISPSQMRAPATDW